MSRTPDQPGDGRVRTALGVVDTRTWQYRDLGVRLWGNQASLRWIDLPAHDLGRISRLLTALLR